MALFSIVQRTNIGSANRIDPDYYQPEYLQLAKRLSQSTLKEKGMLRRYIHSAINFGAYSLCNYIVFVDMGVPYLYTQDVRDNYIDLDNLHFITPDVDELLYKSKVRDRQVVLTMAGVYLGRASVFDYGIHVNSNQATAKITVREDSLNPYYLSTFLNSLYGSFQIRRNKTGTARDNINLGQIQDLFICLPSRRFQLRIEQQVKLGKQRLFDSKQLYTQAEQLLFSELGLQDWKPAHAFTYVRNYSKATRSQRMDAEHFQPKYDELLQRISSIADCKRLVRLVNFIEHGKQPPYVSDGKVFVFSQKYIGEQSIDYDFTNDIDAKTTSTSFAEEFSQYVLRKYDILHYSVGGNIGFCQPYLEPDIKAMPGSFITLIRADNSKIEPLYLALVLNSVIGKMQTDKWKSASAQPYIYPKDIKNFLIPLLPLGSQQNISNLVQHSHAARREAKALIEKAKRAVEIAIEEGEEKALELLK